MHKLFWIPLLLIASSAFSTSRFPTIDEIQKWWSKKQTIEIELDEYDNTKEFYLTNNERAYLSNVIVSNRGQNFMFQTLLILPHKKEVILLEDTIIKYVIKVMDLDRNNISEIVVVDTGRGQGYEVGIRAIVQIAENGSVRTLHEMQFETNEGAVGLQSDRFYEKDVTWDFHDIDGDGIKDLEESITVKKGRENKDPIGKTNVREYLFKNGVFTSYLSDS